MVLEMNHRLQQLSILQAEVAKSLVVENGLENQSTQQTKDFIAKQCAITSRWINDMPLVSEDIQLVKPKNSDLDLKSLNGKKSKFGSSMKMSPKFKNSSDINMKTMTNWPVDFHLRAKS